MLTTLVFFWPSPGLFSLMSAVCNTISFSNLFTMYLYTGTRCLMGHLNCFSNTPDFNQNKYQLKHRILLVKSIWMLWCHRYRIVSFNALSYLLTHIWIFQSLYFLLDKKFINFLNCLRNLHPAINQTVTSLNLDLEVNKRDWTFYTLCPYCLWYRLFLKL